LFRYIVAVAAVAIVAVSCEHTYTDQELRELRDTWYDEGYQAGLDHRAGDYDEGYGLGYSVGHDDGYWFGLEEGEREGYDDGWQDAYAHIEERSEDFHLFLFDWYGNDVCSELFGDWCDS
jgi:hypothetical protein